MNTGQICVSVKNFPYVNRSCMYGRTDESYAWVCMKIVLIFTSCYRTLHLGRAKRMCLRDMSKLPRFRLSFFPAHAQSIIRTFALHFFSLRVALFMEAIPGRIFQDFSRMCIDYSNDSVSGQRSQNALIILRESPKTCFRMARPIWSLNNSYLQVVFNKYSL